MQNQPENLTSGEKELEAALSRLRPAEVSINRTVMIFRLGKESNAAAAARQMRRWQAVAAIFATMLCGTWAIEFIPDNSEIHEANPQLMANDSRGSNNTPKATSDKVWDSPPGTMLSEFDKRSSPVAFPNQNYLALRQRVLAYGIDQIPEWYISSDNNPSSKIDDVRDIMEEFGLPIVQ